MLQCLLILFWFEQIGHLTSSLNKKRALTLGNKQDRGLAAEKAR
jgi:hypothetical protein